MEQAQILLTRLEIAAEIVGLHVNCKKTEYMMFNQDGSNIKTIGDEILKRVEDFNYLGS